MFGRLIKHEFRATARTIPLIFLILAVIASATLLLVYFNLKTLSALAVLLIIALGTAQIYIVTAMILWRYYKSMYGDPAYLTHTLPVPSTALYLSKILVGSFWVAMSYIVFIVVMACAFLSIYRIDTGSFPLLSNVWESALSEVGMTGRASLLILIAAVLFLLYVLLNLIQFYFAITLGSVSKFHKLGLGGPVLVYILLYLVLQALYLGALVIVPAGIKIYFDDAGELAYTVITGNMLSYLESQVFWLPGISSQVATMNPDVDALLIIDAGYLIITLMIFAFLLWMTLRLIRKHTSLR